MRAIDRVKLGNRRFVEAMQIGSSFLAGVSPQVLAGDPSKAGFYTVGLKESPRLCEQVRRDQFLRCRQPADDSGMRRSATPSRTRATCESSGFVSPPPPEE